MSVDPMLQSKPLLTQAFYQSGEPYRDRGACQAELAECLQTNGFCLVQTRLTSTESAMTVAEDRRFALSPMAKHFMSESAENGYAASTHKEMFHFAPQSASVQQPPYWHIPTAPGRCFEAMKGLGCTVFNGINAHILNLLREQAFEQEAFMENDDYIRWIESVSRSSQHVMTSFLYKETNPDVLHAAAHVDKGLLTLCTNPTDLEIDVGGKWISLGEQPPGTVVVLCGYTLERATGGVFRAARHRVRNNGLRRSRVMKVRLDPMLVVHPSSITAGVSRSLLDDLPLPPDSLRIGELMEAFAQTHVSVNTPSGTLLFPSNAPEDQETSLGDLDILPTSLIYCVLDWLRDLRDLAHLGLVCRSFRQLTNTDVLCIPAAETSHVDWGAALDRIDRCVDSHARYLDHDRTPMDVNELLSSVGWTSILGSEMADEQTRKNDSICIRLKDQTCNETFYKIKFGTKLSKVFMEYAQRKGVSASSLRFLLDGERVEYYMTCYSLEMEMLDQIDVMLEQCGD